MYGSDIYIEKYREKKELHVSFMDLVKAYDKVCREELWKLLHESGVYDYFIWSMSNLYDRSRACVRLPSRVRKWVEADMCTVPMAHQYVR